MFTIKVEKNKIRNIFFLFSSSKFEIKKIFTLSIQSKGSSGDGNGSDSSLKSTSV